METQQKKSMERIENIFSFRNRILTLQKIKEMATKKKSESSESKFYEFSQNNSGGSFVTDSNLCHRLFIEADSEEEAISKAEDLGCYWNGVDEGYDCECCGDRWYPSGDAVDLDNMNKRWGGYEVAEWLTEKKDASISNETAISNLKSRYSGSSWLTEPIVENKYGSRRVVGKIRLDSVEQYAQVMADLFGWTKPDCRIFYKDGSKKDIYSVKVK